MQEEFYFGYFADQAIYEAQREMEEEDERAEWENYTMLMGQDDLED